MRPLTDIFKINERYDSVDDLNSYQEEMDEVRTSLFGVTDLEKLLAKVYTYSIQHKKKAVYFEDVSLRKLREFRILLNNLKTSF